MNMRIWRNLVRRGENPGTAFAVLLLCAAASTAAAETFSDLGFDAASKLAAEKGKIVLVDFYTTWCGPCKMLDKNTWTDADVIQLLEQKTVPLRIDAEKEAALAKRYKIEAYPSILLIKPDGKEIDRIVGYRDAKTFIVDFNDSLQGKDSLTRARDKMLAAGTNDPSARMEYGRALAENGREGDALAEYLWCFDHGLEGPYTGFVGVRGSFLLNYIKNLSAHYQPAKEALTVRRDECQAKLAGGSADSRTARDLVALNGALDQTDKNLAVFDSLPAGSQNRHDIGGLIMPELMKARRYADALDATGGTTGFKGAIDRFDQSVNRIAKNNQMRAMMEESLRRMTVNSGANSFEALAGLKREQEAKDMATEILKFDSSTETRDLLADRAKKAGNPDLAGFVKP